MADPFIAEIKIFAGTYAPRGFAFCDGQILPIAQNTALFALLGTTYGGDGRITFALPDLRGRAPMHPGSGPGLTPRSLGEVSGSETVTLLPAQLPAHTHGVPVNSGNSSSSSPAGTTVAMPGENAFVAPGSKNLVAMHPGSIGVAGGGQPHNNLQPCLAVNFIIALTGIFPPRP